MIICFKSTYSIIPIRVHITWLGIHSPVDCMVSSNWYLLHKNEWEHWLTLQVSSSTFHRYIILNSGCLHSQRAVLRKKAYFVHIADSSRHGKAYGKHSYAFPGESQSVCQLFHQCICDYMSICERKHLWHVSRLYNNLQCLRHSMLNKQNTSHIPQYSVREIWTQPLCTSLLSPL